MCSLFDEFEVEYELEVEYDPCALVVQATDAEDSPGGRGGGGGGGGGTLQLQRLTVTGPRVTSDRPR